MRKTTFYLLIALLWVFSSGLLSIDRKPQPAELILIKGKIVTLDESWPLVEALAVREGRIAALGSNNDISAYRGPSTRVIDLKGQLAVPGLIESHGHFSSLGQSKIKLNLMKVKNWEDVIAMVKKAVSKAKPGEWITGRGWHQEKWNRTPQPNVDGLPVHHALSRISPQNPVMLSHASGHSCFANARAMALAGIDENTPNPKGGEIVRDKNNHPIGIFRETAIDLISKAMAISLSKRTSREVAEELIKIALLADKACLSNGITTFHDAGASYSTVELYKRLVDKKKLGVRLNVMIGESNEHLKGTIARYKYVGYGDNHLTVRSIKRLIDGALGSHGAWLLKPYNSLPESSGLNTESIAVMKETARIAVENGFQLCTHAIGDRANRETLNIYEEAFKKHPEKKDLRWRIEHAQHLSLTDIPRFGKLGVIAAMQSIHCTSDAPWVIKRLGKKRAEEGAYVWRKLMDSGAVICNGTDVPVEDINPIANFYAAVTRKTKDGTVFYGNQRMTREEALRSYTINGAYAAFEEDIKGTLSPGKLADITVLSQDIMTIPADDLLKTRILCTIVGGKVLFSAVSLANADKKAAISSKTF